MIEVGTRIGEIRAEIAAACGEAGREPSEVRLLAVTKTRPVRTVRAAYASGCRWFGENRLQELRDKAVELSDLPDLSWSVIGHVQRNKAAVVVEVADELQSLDSLELAADLDRRLDAAGRRLDVLVQVNTSGEATKSGLMPEEVDDFTRGLRSYPRLVPQGLMTVALPSTDDREVAACFDELMAVRDRLRDRDGGGWDDLSMGMSADSGWPSQMDRRAVGSARSCSGLAPDRRSDRAARLAVGERDGPEDDETLATRRDLRRPRTGPPLCTVDSRLSDI